MKPWNILRRAAMAALLAIPVTSVAEKAPEAPSGTATSNQFWWPERLDLSPLRAHNGRSNPLGDSFDYAEEFKKLDYAALKQDLNAALTASQDWWPADYGNYGPLFIRMAWHSAGTYRTIDGRGGAGGGQQRFEPLNSWPDNANLDKARRLLWPIKQKYGNRISWADLMILAGNVAMENMGFKTLGFAGGRADDWEAEMVDWGAEKKWLAGDRRDRDGKLKGPLAAVQMGLIYVNPEGPGGNHDPLAAARDIRESFGRMAMDDEETVALIAGGHTFGKVHGAHSPAGNVGPEPAAAPLEEQGLGWKNARGKGNAEDTVTSGLEGAWTSSPVKWTHMFLDNLLRYEWKQTKSPAGAVQWIPTDEYTANLVPDAHVPGKFHAPIMLTTDLALARDQAYRKIAERFRKEPKAFEEAFARAWFKLTHRDMGPRARYLGPEVPAVEFPWQDPLPRAAQDGIDAADVRTLKNRILAADIGVPALVRTAWASASTFRASDMRGGANGARLRLAPQRGWEVNRPKELAGVLKRLEDIQRAFNQKRPERKKVSLADVIVLAGNAAVEKAARDADLRLSVPFRPGRVDASPEQTDVASFAVMEPSADGFRNYFRKDRAERSPAEMLVDKAAQLNLTVPEMTVLLGGLRVLNANADGSNHGVLTTRPGALTNDFFLNLLDMSTRWKKSDATRDLYEGLDRKTGRPRWTATSVDLVFGSNAELRAVAEVYAQGDGKERLARDFAAAWAKVMDLDRFDLRK
jgi:catalase-peroxidase